MKRAFVTGANRGIGLELVRQLLANDWQVFATCRQPDTAEALKALQTPQLHIVPLEVTDPASIDAALQSVQNHAEGLDLLVNNAGIIRAPGIDRQQPLDQLTFDSGLTVIKVNAIAPIQIAQRFLNLLKNGESPKIINMTSGMGSLTHARGKYYDYRASKAALNMYTRALAQDIAESGIIAIVLDPGWVKTDMGGSNASLTPEQSVEGILNVVAKLTPADNGEFFAYHGKRVPW